MEASSTSNGPSAVDRMDAASPTRVCDSPGHSSSAVLRPAIPVGERYSRQTPCYLLISVGRVYLDFDPERPGVQAPRTAIMTLVPKMYGRPLRCKYQPEAMVRT